MTLGVPSAVIMSPAYRKPRYGFFDICRDDRRRGIGAHAARVGTDVAFVTRLVILGRGQRQDRVAIGNDDEARLFAFQELLNDDSRARLTEAATGEHIGRRLLGLLQRHSHDDAFAGCEAVGLDDDRCALFTDVVDGRLEFRKVPVGCCRDCVPCQEVLGKRLGAFELRGCRRRTEAGQAQFIEPVDHARDQRRLGSDDGQGDTFGLCQRRKRFDVVGGDVHIAHLVLARGAGIAGCHQDFIDAW